MQLPASASIAQMPELLPLLDRAVAQAGAGELVIDASALQELDSSTLSLLLQARRRVKQAGGSMVVRGAPPKLLELARLYGVNELLSLEPSAGAH